MHNEGAKKNFIWLFFYISSETIFGNIVKFFRNNIIFIWLILFQKILLTLLAHTFIIEESQHSCLSIIRQIVFTIDKLLQSSICPVRVTYTITETHWIVYVALRTLLIDGPLPCGTSSHMFPFGQIAAHWLSNNREKEEVCVGWIKVCHAVA